MSARPMDPHNATGLCEHCLEPRAHCDADHVCNPESLKLHDGIRLRWEIEALERAALEAGIAELVAGRAVTDAIKDLPNYTRLTPDQCKLDDAFSAATEARISAFKSLLAARAKAVR